jgi:hypothetical protein
VGRNTPPKLIAPSYESTASSLPWVGAAQLQKKP